LDLALFGKRGGATLAKEEVFFEELFEEKLA
jgi:hypothetical protein